MNKKTITTAAVALIAGFGAGYYMHPASAPAAGGTVARIGSAYGGRGGAGGGFLSGTVAAKDSESITIDTRDGSSHIVLVTPATSVSKSVSGAVSDVAVGSNIIVSGTTNGDGSVTAALIQLRPATPPAAQ